ncbi:MAG TPA: HNH endonuclease [Armatimonadetes bacterium]|nr:HNH endonuclease [Armatimonadota bacterium]
MDGQVLVLNQNYEPLNITSLRRAIILLHLGKAEVVETDNRLLHSEKMVISAPSVVRLAYYVKRPVPKLHISRKSIMARDNHTCQYCGRRDGAMTLDHVIPKVRGGTDDWTNLVCCCIPCNNRKGNRTPEEAGMKLLCQPQRPRYVPYISFPKFLAACRQEKWRTYLIPYAKGLEV